jgi:hypothetical protein
MQLLNRFSPSFLLPRQESKTIGGSKGNIILEWVSGAPNKETVVDEPATIFDYDELEKYGFRKLATPIMNAGGRLAMYRLLDMDMPEIKSKPKPEDAPEVVLDQMDAFDTSRYQGMRLGLKMDDAVMAQALQDSIEKQRLSVDMRSSIAEQEYDVPSADKRSTSPRMTPDWTSERVDDTVRRQGSAISWARQTRDEQILPDQFESIDMHLSQRAYSLLTAVLVATSFGKSTPTFGEMTGLIQNSQQLAELSQTLNLLKLPALALLLSSIGSSIFCTIAASEKKRDALIWLVKGLLGGPWTLRQLRELPGLVSRAERKQAKNRE